MQTQNNQSNTHSLSRLPLTDAQLNVWFHQQIDPNATGYNIGQSIRFKGNLNLKRLAIAQQAVIDRFDNLRCRIEVINNEPFQIIDDNVNATSKFWDLSGGFDAEEVSQKIITQEFDQIFDLQKDRLARFGLIQIEDNEWVWFWVLHHIVADASGGQLALQYMAEVYRSGVASRKNTSLTWAQAVNIDQSYRLSEAHKEDQVYWQKTLGRLENVCSLSDRHNATHIPTRPSFCSASLSRAEFDSIIELSKQLRTSHFAVFVAIYAIYLSRITGKQEVCLCMPISGRDQNLRDVGGMLSNIVAVRLSIRPENTLKEIIGHALMSYLDALPHSRYPAYEISRQSRANNISDPLGLNINLQAFALSLDFGQVHVTVNKLDNSGPVNDSALQIFDYQDDGPVEIRFDYEETLFEKSSVLKHLDRLIQLFRNIPDPDAIVASLNVLDEGEEKSILKTSCGERVESAASFISLPERFEQQVARTPEATALVFGEETLTYRELDQRANQLARHLISLGIGPEQVVALALPRSFEMVVALLSVLKSGAAYLPLDPDYPTARLAFMLTDSRASLLITAGDLMVSVVS